MLMAAAAGASAAKKAVGALSSEFQSYDRAKDAQRRANNAAAYAAATVPGGNPNAYRYLKFRTGNYGAAVDIGPIPGVYDGQGAVSGWASAPARDDAATKMRALQPQYEGNTSTSDLGAPTGYNPTTGQRAGVALAGPGTGTMGMILVVGAVLLIVAGLHRKD